MKRGQAWSFDLMIALMLFVLGIVSFYLYTLNSSQEAESIIEQFEHEATIISDILLSEGTPENWNTVNVIKTGITTNNKINQTKLENFYTLAQVDYEKTKTLFNTNNNYLIVFSENITINSNQVNSIGLSPNQEKNIIRIDRATIYNNKPLSLYVYVWN